MQRFSNKVGTRVYNFSAATRTTFSSSSSAEVAIGTLNGLREVMITATSRCFIAFGSTGMSAADGTDAANLPIEAGEKFHLRIPAGLTHYRVIRDAADGVLNVIPVA